MFKEILVPMQFQTDMFVNDSYQNDACPSFIFTGNIKEDEVEQRIDSETYVKVWVDHQCEDEREIHGTSRYQVVSLINAEQRNLMCTDDLSEVFQLLLHFKLQQWADGAAWPLHYDRKELSTFLKNS